MGIIKELKVLRLSEGGILPTRAYEGDLGYDLYASEDITIAKEGQGLVPTSISVEFPEGWGGFIKDRSSMAVKGVHTYAGVIDHGYRGEIKIVMRNNSTDDFAIRRGDKIAQLVPIPVSDWNIVEVDNGELASSDRHDKGFGSSNLKNS
ncbi:MAG: dUTP diphosphatase [Nitrospinae bacterium]|nr:dUTP diphosphatase [Nitrospinota bacterium]